MNSFKIGKNSIGFDKPLYFIADIGANHDGDINRAFKLIELAKEAGAHAAKFQNFIAAKIVSRSGFDFLGNKLSHQSMWERSIYETYEDASISYEWTAKLKEKCDEVDIEYFTSPYDFESVDNVDPFVEAYKIGSGDVTWHEIIEYIAGKGKPILMATGASTLHEVKLAMNIIRKLTSKVVLMQCNTNYTANPDNFRFINLNVLKAYAQEFSDAIIGLSDHTHGHATVLGAVALGARVFEKHFTDDNTREGPDHTFAMNPSTWVDMVARANEVYLALGDGDKTIEDNELETAVVQRRCLRFTENLHAGHIIEKSDLIPLRPRNHDGMPPYEINNLIGKVLKRGVVADDYVRKEDLVKC
jgi:sialic acid synthase SpsE